MTIEQLRAYKGLQRDVRMLELEIQRMEHELKLLCDPSFVKVQNYDGMPRSGQLPDSTANLGIALANGDIPPEAKDIANALRRKQAEWQQKKLQLLYVDVWLEGLTSHERWVIRMFYIERLSWHEMVLKSSDEFGSERSKDTLRRIRNRVICA